jgi:hypothetical protein
MTAVDELLAYCFEGRHPALAAELAGWLAGSRRLRAFFEENNAKIRAKLRPVRDEGGLLDVRAELAAAAALLSEERFTLAYEAYAAGKRGGPDFTVTFKTHTRFNIEVRRIRPIEARPGGASDGAAGNDNGAPDGESNDAGDMNGSAPAGKLSAVFCDKVRQMPPGSANFLWLAAEGELDVAHVAAAAAILRKHAEGKDEAFFRRRGHASAAAFLKQYGQMSGVLLWQAGRATLWLNPLARHKPPAPLAAALHRLGSGT